MSGHPRQTAMSSSPRCAGWRLRAVPTESPLVRSLVCGAFAARIGEPDQFMGDKVADRAEWRENQPGPPRINDADEECEDRNQCQAHSENARESRLPDMEFGQEILAERERDEGHDDERQRSPSTATGGCAAEDAEEIREKPDDTDSDDPDEETGNCRREPGGDTWQSICANCGVPLLDAVSYTHLRAHETDSYLV